MIPEESCWKICSCKTWSRLLASKTTDNLTVKTNNIKLSGSKSLKQLIVSVGPESSYANVMCRAVKDALRLDSLCPHKLMLCD